MFNISIILRTLQAPQEEICFFPHQQWKHLEVTLPVTHSNPKIRFCKIYLTQQLLATHQVYLYAKTSLPPLLLLLQMVVRLLYEVHTEKTESLAKLSSNW